MNDVNSKEAEELEIVNLLTSLVRTHYLEKSDHFQDAMDFEKLFKLDQLQQLKSLEELDKLKELSRLSDLKPLESLSKILEENRNTLDPLVHLEKLVDLVYLKQLDKLEELVKLDKLGELNKLESLNRLSELKPLENLANLEGLRELARIDLSKLKPLEHLTKLDDLQELSKLERLSELKPLEHLAKLEALRELSKLDLSELKPLENLAKLEELRELSKLEQLAALQQLDRLTELQSLEKLADLKELEKLSTIRVLEKLLEEHRTTLGPLVHLEKLVDLAYLKQLDKLENLVRLDRLEDLKKLDKLDRINDAHFIESLNKLDKIHLLEKSTKILAIQQFVGFGLDVLKFAIAGVLMVFLLSRETGREIAVKALPALGFGSSAQVNLGLKLLVGETSPEQFQSVVENVKKRIDAEIESIMSTSSTLTVNRRIELADQLLSYNFQEAGVDLSQDVRKKLESKLTTLHETAVSRLDYEMAQARGNQNSQLESKLREIKLLLIQKQYPALLEKSLPMWGKHESTTMAAIAGLMNLKLQDPVTLEDMIRKMPGQGAL